MLRSSCCCRDCQCMDIGPFALSFPSVVCSATCRQDRGAQVSFASVLQLQRARLFSHFMCTFGQAPEVALTAIMSSRLPLGLCDSNHQLQRRAWPIMGRVRADLSSIGLVGFSFSSTWPPTTLRRAPRCARHRLVKLARLVGRREQLRQPRQRWRQCFDAAAAAQTAPCISWPQKQPGPSLASLLTVSMGAASSGGPKRLAIIEPGGAIVYHRIGCWLTFCCPTPNSEWERRAGGALACGPSWSQRRVYLPYQQNCITQRARARSARRQAACARMALGAHLPNGTM